MKKALFWLGLVANLLITMFFVAGADSLPVGFKGIDVPVWFGFIPQLITGLVIIAALWVIWVIVFHREISERLAKYDKEEEFESIPFQYIDVEYKEIPAHRVSREKLISDGEAFEHCYHIAVDNRVNQIIKDCKTA